MTVTLILEDAKMIHSLTTTDTLDFSVFSLMVWGSPGSFGVLDKERRMAALGDWIANDTEHDVYLLNDLWMRPDHGTIRDAVMSRNGKDVISCDINSSVLHLSRILHDKSE